MVDLFMYEKFSTSKIGIIPELRNVSQIKFLFNKNLEGRGRYNMLDLRYKKTSEVVHTPEVSKILDL